MANIDIPVSVDLKASLDLPACEDIKLRAPLPFSIQLPTGGSIKSIADISKGIPTDCALNFSLMLQISPLLASMECVVKILKLLKPLIDVITNLPMPPVKALQDFAKAAADLAPCLLIPTPASMIPFVRDILCLILKVLECLVGQLKTVLALMRGIQIDLDVAKAAGNFELQQTLECAKENAQASAENLTKGIEPVGVVLDLVGPFMALAGVQPIQLPQIGDQTDTEALEQLLRTLQGVVGTIRVVTDALGGC